LFGFERTTPELTEKFQSAHQLTEKKMSSQNFSVVGLMVQGRPWAQWVGLKKKELDYPDLNFVDELVRVVNARDAGEKAEMVKWIKSQIQDLQFLHATFANLTYATAKDDSWHYEVAPATILLRGWVAVCRSLYEILYGGAAGGLLKKIHLLEGLEPEVLHSFSEELNALLQIEGSEGSLLDSLPFIRNVFFHGSVNTTYVGNPADWKVEIVLRTLEGVEDSKSLKFMDMFNAFQNLSSYFYHLLVNICLL
jgi:hypothetical protein